MNSSNMKDSTYENNKMEVEELLKIMQNNAWQLSRQKIETYQIFIFLLVIDPLIVSNVKLLKDTLYNRISPQVIQEGGQCNFISTVLLLLTFSAQAPLMCEKG